MTLNQRFARWLWLGILCLLPLRVQAQDAALPQLIYTSDKGRPTQLFVVNADGSDGHPLDDRKQYEAFPVVSPDGSMIAYLGQDDEGFSNVYLMNNDGANPRRLTDLGQCAFDLPSYVWSPDSASVTVSYFCAQESANHVVILALDGTLKQELSVARARLISSLGGWTPDGEHLIINGHVPSSTTAFDTSTIFSYDLKSGALKQILSRDDMTDARLSPDGSKIVFLQAVDGKVSEMYVMDADGGNIEQIPIDAPLVNGLRLPGWSPDGQTIAFTAFRGSSGDLFTVRADGTGLTRVTDYARASSPAWLPAVEATPAP